jgi:hypothetical protein
MIITIDLARKLISQQFPEYASLPIVDHTTPHFLEGLEQPA